MAKKLVGVVSSDLPDKTIIVTVTRRETHPLYRKQYTVTTKYAAHDEKNEANKGDRVEISEIPPKSKRKTFKLNRIIETGHGTVELKEEAEA
ncbi:ribosomal protein S17 [candidate division TM7 genomosp. GTL1]|nr:ribosomal protein S17 [candidate division TM7 genomosp. GTL1]